jgi:hypothetical protein
VVPGNNLAGPIDDGLDATLERIPVQGGVILSIADFACDAPRFDPHGNTGET